MLNKSLNHKSIIDAFEDVCKEFTQMSDSDFQAMINDSELDSLGSLLYETNTVIGCEDLGYTNAMVVNNEFPVNCGHKEYKLWITEHNPSSAECSDNYYGFSEDGIWKKAA